MSCCISGYVNDFLKFVFAFTASKGVWNQQQGFRLRLSDSTRKTSFECDASNNAMFQLSPAWSANTLIPAVPICLSDVRGNYFSMTGKSFGWSITKILGCSGWRFAV